MVEQDDVVGFVSCVEHQLAALLVAPDHQGKGVGSVLLAHALRGREVATLNVYAANLCARRFYEQRGFRATGDGVDDATGALECFMEYRAAV
ncbi:GNAT family N-acetyltransferase [Zymobacter sp. IVIA_12111.31 C1]|uniref:GNAT family N-acetyltransferase n=1 Tax=Zymobacter sp. IVIA_12111.31 C1 TaxID=3394854 RepID=UPI0039C49BEE